MYDILKNESYLGTAYMYKTKKAVPAKHPQLKKYSKHKKSTQVNRPREDWIGVPVPQIVDQKTWDAAQKLLSKNAHRARRNNNKNKYLLRGLVICGECGCMAPGYVSNKKTYYSCAAKRNENLTTIPHNDVNITVRHQPFDDKVWGGLGELLGNPDNLWKQLEKRLSKNNMPSKAAKSDQSKIEKELQRLDVQEKRILDAYREEIIELEELKEQKAKIARSRKALNVKQKAALSQLEGSGRTEITMSMLGDVSDRFQRVMAKADFETREKLANLLINSVALHADKAIVKGNIPVYQGDVLNPQNQRVTFSRILVVSSRIVK